MAARRKRVERAARLWDVFGSFFCGRIPREPEAVARVLGSSYFSDQKSAELVTQYLVFVRLRGRRAIA